MLWLKVVRHEGEFVKCGLTGQILTYGMRYFYDDEKDDNYSCVEYYNLYKTDRDEKFESMDLYTAAKDRWDEANSERINRREERSENVLNLKFAWDELN